MSLKKYVPQPIKNKYHLLQSYWANVRYGFPANALKIIGVTGTDGKTTTATMIYEILKEAGYKVGLITTVSAKAGKKEIPTGLHTTTPDPWEVPKFLHMMLEEGMKWVVMEVTSHGLDQNRISNITFEKAIYTNITKEHLDYHGTWRELARAKTKLIDMVKEGGEIIYNIDEKGGKFISKKVKRNKKVLLDTKCSKDQAKKIKVNREGMKFNYEIRGKDFEITLPILGRYNISNAGCAIKACELLVKPKFIVKALQTFGGIRGRGHIVRRKRPCLTMVDFAHTPNALKKILQTTSDLKVKGSRLINVFGCAGLRDRYKRAKMGKIAAKHADVVILTAEDPRTEMLEKINDTIIEGAHSSKGKLVKRFPNHLSFKKTKISILNEKIDENIKNKHASIFAFDEQKPRSRQDAIDFAVRLARSEDIIVITGKGHEESLCFGKEEYDWSDFPAVTKAVRRKYKNKK